MLLRYAVLAGLVSLAACKNAPPPPPKAAPAAVGRRAQLRDLSGSVQVKRNEGEGWVAGADGLALVARDEVRTLRSARVKIEFDAGTSIVLDEDSLVSISPADEAPAVELLAGRLDADVASAGGDFQVEAAGGRVRGTRGEITFQ